jgi:hypothetical protein
MSDPQDKKQGGANNNEQLVEGTSLWKDAFRRLKKNKAAMAGLIIVVFMALCAVGYDVIAKHVT